MAKKNAKKNAKKPTQPKAEAPAEAPAEAQAEAPAEAKSDSSGTCFVEILTPIDGGYQPGDVVRLDSKIAKHYISEKSAKKVSIKGLK